MTLLEDIARTLDDIRNEFGFDTVGMVGGVVWGFIPGDDRLWAWAKGDEADDFTPCDRDRWETISGAPMPRSR